MNILLPSKKTYLLILYRVFFKSRTNLIFNRAGLSKWHSCLHSGIFNLRLGDLWFSVPKLKLSYWHFALLGSFKRIRQFMKNRQKFKLSFVMFLIFEAISSNFGPCLTLIRILLFHNQNSACCIKMENYWVKCFHHFDLFNNFQLRNVHKIYLSFEYQSYNPKIWQSQGEDTYINIWKGSN